MDGASSSSSSIPAKPASTSRWDVFLSFRGVDTRRGFTGHLLSSLDRKGINTFRDNLDLERGEEISDELMKAIEESMFALIILSPNYASSTWCLKELQKILECKKTFGQSVFPIFYGVDSSDVRHQRGSFAKAFGEHEEKFREDRVKVDRWRDALREVADYSGWDSKDWTEAALVETIAGQILKKLIPKLPSCTENLVGIESRIKEVRSRLDMGLNEVRFIGIWGMGGIGKTTIARLVYEAIKKKFEVSCFLENIREKSDTNGLVHIQRELLSHLNISTDFYNSHDGKKILAKYLRNRKVLLVLDDVSEPNHLESFAGKQEWFGPGSRVIITTRDMHLLVTHGVHEICEALCLDNNEGRELLCWKAFKRDQPEEEYLSLCKEVVEYTGGLPLALEVLGSHLHGRTVEVWHSALKQIRSVPHSKIQDTLKISYDSLEPQYKDLFLDIACFFKGMYKYKVINILENCGDHPKIGIDILMERSLVTLVTRFEGDYKTLEMHDLLQEMGRNIVFQESPNDPGRRSRLWSQKDIDQVLTNNKGTDKIQGIVLNSVRPYKARWSTEAFSKTSQLRLLMLDDIQLPLGLNCLPSALKVLGWGGCPLKTLPLTNQLWPGTKVKTIYQNIFPNFVIIMITLKADKNFHNINFDQSFEMLKSIYLSYSRNLKQLPDFVGVPNLESLVLKGCWGLTEVHPSLVHHKKLEIMHLKRCDELKALPCKMEMSSLKYLNLSGCSNFEYLPEFGECMKNLSRLDLGGTAITKLPSSLVCLVGLAHLHLKNCKNLVYLPDTIGELKSLLILDVSYCSKLCSLPESLKEIKCLEELDASETAIRELPSSVFYLENLKGMSFAGCNKHRIGFRLPPSKLCLSSLCWLDLSYCSLSEESMPDDFFQLSSLISLDLSGNNFVRLPSSISKLPKLENLRLNWCKKLQQLPELPSSILELSACNCDSLDISKFNPSKTCGTTLTTERLSYRECTSSSKEPHLPKVMFDMLISKGDIIVYPYADWYEQGTEFGRIARISLRHNCLPPECLGFALCFTLGNDSMFDPGPCQVRGSLVETKGWVFINSRNLPMMPSCATYLYILYLSIDKCHDRFLEGGDYSEIDFVLESNNSDVKISSPRWRLVRKQDVEDIYRHRFWDLS